MCRVHRSVASVSPIVARKCPKEGIKVELNRLKTSPSKFFDNDKINTLKIWPVVRVATTTPWISQQRVQV